MELDLSFDFTGVERPKYEPVPEDVYRVMCSALNVVPSKSNPDNVVANGTYEIVNHPEYAGKKVFANQVIAGPSANTAYIKVWLESFIGEPLTGEFSFDPEQFVGLEADCFIGLKPDYKDNTKTVNEIKYWIPPFDE